MRQVILDTETTGLDVDEGHRIIEVGCVEIMDRRLTRRHFHRYINPEREIDDGAFQVHGITREFLQDKPVFADIWQDLLEFIDGAELIMHNALFDLRFINQEMAYVSTSLGVVSDYCPVLDSLELAREKHPGQKNNLDALCKRYSVDNSQRDLHGALLDAEILAEVYLLMTGGQVALSLGETDISSGTVNKKRVLTNERPPLRIIKASAEEIHRHEAKLEQLELNSSSGCIWKSLD
ncbi:MAG: DNA polymerase III subunit epsilon [Candidatus Azotimanducaceae bacterium]|uniref:DNA polymerase III subunit epsilon n=1 Tax=OM182 bacterium TaxID=2510334 RepID=A0A520S145_9GAMM|nr:DNA polymerase III subunit epsilon [Gammaproteobacteria bacterium]OUV67903.1 MAG: DNA polymerase III subunit epsilon [Gammaproteobacteria bacterium TMED133]RZO76179.1 MAG: DNA polymerase III subunit epsilon [OM182 bacterium]